MSSLDKPDKPKWKTTEFWVQVVVMIITLLIMSGIVEPGTKFDKGISLVVLCLSTMGYTYARTTIKKVKETTKGKAKPGYKSSEYWFTAVSLVSGAVVSSGAVEGSEVDKVLGLITTGLSSMGYAPMRAQLKANGKSIILFFAIFVAGCSGPSIEGLQTRYKAVAPEYYVYVRNDPKLTNGEKEIRYLTIGGWRIDAELSSKEYGKVYLEEFYEKYGKWSF